MLKMSSGESAKTVLGDLNLLNEYGQIIKTSTLWKSAPVILIFLRHFACVACRAHAREVWNQRAFYQLHGYKIHFIGNGSPQQVAVFRAEMHLEHASIFTDPELRVFSAAGFKRGFLATFGPSAIRNFIKLNVQGYRQTAHAANDGDRLQMGGVLNINTSGVVQYRFASQATGHFPPQSDRDYMTGASARPFELHTNIDGRIFPDFSRR